MAHVQTKSIAASVAAQLRSIKGDSMSAALISLTVVVGLGGLTAETTNQPHANGYEQCQHHRLAIAYVRAQAKRANNSTDEALIVKVMTVSSWLLSLLRFPAACP